MTIEVMEPNFLRLKDTLLNGGVRTIDEVMSTHDQFLDECLKECLLTDQNLFLILTKINQCCNYFSSMIQRYFNGIGANESLQHAITESE